MEEDKAIEKFDPSKLMDGVKDRIKATFVSLIPDVQWEQMCKVEMDKFFQPIPKKDYYGKVESYLPSEFETIVMNLMREQCTLFIKDLISKPEYSMEKIWDSSITGKSVQKIKLSDHLDAMIKEKMPEMLQSMVSSVMADSFYHFFNNIQNKLNR